MSGAATLIELARARRSVYKLGRRPIVPDTEVRELVNAAILDMPSSFNTQSTRMVVLLNEEHDKLWDIAIDSVHEQVRLGIVPQEVWQNQTKPKLQGFKAAYGTILFYEDLYRVKSVMKKFPLYEGRFTAWSEQSNAMHQWFLWTGLTSLGFGVNMQHYDPLIDERVEQEWNISPDWKLLAQMVFGSPEGPPKAKIYDPVEDRVKIYGNKS